MQLKFWIQWNLLCRCWQMWIWFGKGTWLFT